MIPLPFIKKNSCIHYVFLIIKLASSSFFIANILGVILVLAFFVFGFYAFMCVIISKNYSFNTHLNINEI